MSKATILIVEDEAIVAEDLASKLRRAGLRGRRHASDAAKRPSPWPGRRPGSGADGHLAGGPMDGIEAAEAIRRQHDVPVIYLTAHSDRATLARAKLTEPFGYILKPFDERELATQIEMALYKHQAEHTLRQAHDELELRVQERTKELNEAQEMLKEANDTLEMRVAERTAELEAANVLLRDSRRAALNMMEDAEAARRKAEAIPSNCDMNPTSASRQRNSFGSSTRNWNAESNSAPASFRKHKLSICTPKSSRQ